VAKLRHSGWTVTDGIGSVEARLEIAADPAAALDQLGSLLPAALNVEAVGRRAGSKLVVRLINGVPELLDATIDPRELFDERGDQDSATAALDGDAGAALALPMDWSVHATFAFARLIETPGQVAVTVSLTTATVSQYIVETNVSDVERLLISGGQTVRVALDTTECVRLGLLILSGVPSDVPATPILLTRPRLLAGELAGGHLLAAGALLPVDPTSIPPVWYRAANHICIVAAQLVWRRLATDEIVEAVGISLVFVGYKKATFVLPDAGAWESEHVKATLALREWALSDISPDRLLAVRQVMSLYDVDGAPFAHPFEIQASSEIIYLGLRTDAVAEAVKSFREAHAQAQGAARETVKSATDMLKGATERMLAALVAVGAVLMTNASRVLPDDTGRLLLLFVAAFLGLLAAASATLEGPLLSLPAKKLRPDLAHEAGLMTDKQRDRIDRLPSLVAARRRIQAVRWVIPIAYIVFASLLLLFGHPGRYR
jgi:hypothetical protein